MNQPWKRFLLCQFPAAALVLALIAQAVAWALADVPMRRDRTDELALAVLSDPTNYRVILLADSITRNATARYSLGGPGDVANLATHAHFGMAGEVLLLQRYLSTHRAPLYVVMAFAPDMYEWVSDIRLIRYTLWHTFKQPGERSFLKAYLPEIDRRDWLPAVADLQVRVVEPFLSFVKQRYLAFRKRGAAPIAAGSLEPNPDAPVDVSMEIGTATLDRAISEGLKTNPAPINAASLREVCRLSEQYGFRINLVWPPMATEIERAIVARGALGELEAQIRMVLGNHCQVDAIYDFNKIRTYESSNFHRDMVHLFGDGWEQRYASDLRRYLEALPDGNAPPEATKPPLANLKFE
jgi:hypothetical protein